MIKHNLIVTALVLFSPSLSLAQETPQPEQSVSARILQTYLKTRKAHIAQHSFLYRDETPMQQALGKHVDGYSQAADVEMKVVKEEGTKNDYVIITTRVLGNPEEFKGKAVLEGEKELFKFFLIDAYRNKLKEDTHCGILPAWFSKKCTSDIIILDKETKITVQPRCAGSHTERVVNEAYAVHGQMHMTLKTVIPFQVFEENVRQHFA